MEAAKKPVSVIESGGAGAVEMKPAARKLGRGLSSLMALDTPVRVEAPGTQTVVNKQITPHHAPGPVTTGGLSDYQSIPISKISPSRFQPRKTMDEGAISRLADSIKRSGLMQPVVVRPVKSGGGEARYELVAGERRWRAAQSAGLSHIPALVREMVDELAAEWGLVENVQREDLNAMERAWALKALADKFKLQHSDLAERVGLERSTVANLIRLTELEPDIAGMIARGELSAGHGKALLSAPPGMLRLSLAKEAVAHGYSVRRLEQLAAASAAPTKAAKGSATAGMEDLAGRLAGLRDLERQIGQQLGTKVIITTDRKGKRGRMMIEFYGLDHFDGLLNRLNIRTQ